MLLKNFKVDYILNSGFSGAAYNGAKIGDLIVANQVIYNHNTLELDPDLIKLTKSIINSDEQSYKIGTVQVFNQFVHSKVGLSKDVLAVDMESYHIAKTALKYGKKTMVIRSISDILSERDPDKPSIAICAGMGCHGLDNGAIINHFLFKYSLRYNFRDILRLYLHIADFFRIDNH